MREKLSLNLKSEKILKMKTERMIIPSVFFGIATGIILFEKLQLGIHFVFFLLSMFIGVIILIFIFRSEKNIAGVVSLIMILLGGAIIGILLSGKNEEDFILTEHADAKVEVYGKVVNEPEKRESYLALTAEVRALISATSCEQLKERALIKADRLIKVDYGDDIWATGKIDLPEPFLTDTERVFAYDDFLRKDKIGVILSYAEVKSLDTGGNSLKKFLYSTKDRYLRSINRLIPDPEVSLLGGLTAGTKRALGKELEKDFRTTGVIHVVVLSGFHVVVVAEGIMFLLRYFSLRWRTVLAITGIILFVILVGASATVVRAGIMATIALIARYFGREALALSSLFFAGVVMLLFNPLLLLHDPSFQLSFTATLGLILLSPKVESWFRWVKFTSLREIVIATTSVQIAVLPLLLFMMGELSLVALPVNLLVLPSVPFAMLFGFLAGVIGLVPVMGAVLGPVFGMVAFFILKYELLIVKMFASLPFSSVFLPPFPFWLMVLLYVFLGLAFLKTKTPRQVQGVFQNQEKVL